MLNASLKAPMHLKRRSYLVEAKIILCIMITALSLIIMHFAALFFLQGETFVRKHVEHTANAMIVTAADRLGLEQKKVPEPDKTTIELLNDEALKQNVNPIYLRAIMKIESGGNYVISNKNAIGWMQVIPSNYKRCGLSDAGELHDKKKNIKCGVKIWKEELQTYKGNPILAAKSYNGGPNCVKNRCAESENYVIKMLDAVIKETPALG